MLTKYVLAWIPMTVIAILNGTIRQFLILPLTSELTAHQVSCFTGIVLFGIYIWWLERKWPLESGRQALFVGGLWLGMTVAFEFIFGHYVMGNPWPHLLHDYNFLEGRLWAVVLLFVTVAPYLFYKREELLLKVKRER